MNRMRTPRLHEEHLRQIRGQADLLDLLWDEDKENLPPHAILDSLSVQDIRVPAHIRDPESPELGTARVGFASRFEELRIQNEGPPETLRPFRDTQPHYYQGDDRPFRNAAGEDPFPRATRGPRQLGRVERPNDDWEIYVDDRDRERHYFHYSSDEVSLDSEVAEEEVESDTENPGAFSITSSLEAQIAELEWLDDPRASSPEPEPELPELPAPQMNRRLVPSLSEGTLLAPRPIARMRRRRGSRALREQARMGSPARDQVVSEA